MNDRATTLFRRGPIAGLAAAGAAVFVAGGAAGAAERTRTVAVSGSATAPGTPVPGNPATVKFQTFGAPTINENGVIAFQAKLNDPRYSLTNTGFYTGTSPANLTRILQANTPAPGMSDGAEVTQISTYTSVGTIPYSNQVLETGQAIVVAQVRSGTNYVQVPFLGAPGGGGLGPLAVAGQATPSGNGTWGGFYTVASTPSGRVAVHDTNRQALWTGTSAASLTPVVDGPHPVGHQFRIDGFTLSRDGGVTYAQRLTPNSAPSNTTTVAFHVAGSSVTRLLATGDTPPGAPGPVTTVYAPRVNLDGQFVIGAALVNPAGRGAWVGSLSGGGALSKVAVPGDAAPGQPGFTIRTVTAPVVTGEHVYVKARLDGPDATFSNGHAFYVAPLSAPDQLTLIGREGAAIPGLAAGWSLDANADQFSVNAAGQMLIYAYNALLGYDRSLGLVPLAKTGDRVEVSPGVFKTIADRFILAEDDYLAVDGSWNEGMPRALNDQGVVTYRAKFSDGTQAVLTTRIPVAGDATFDGVVNFDDFRIVYANIGKPGTRAEGDFNFDGRVSFADYQILERNFGRHPPGVAGVGAEDWQALDEGRALVPEPGGFALALAGAIVGLGRRGRRARG